MTDSRNCRVALSGLALALVGLVPETALAKPHTLQDAIGNPSDLKLSGSLRIRHEALDGQPRAGLPADDEQIAVRTTLAAEYQTGHFRIGGELFDSRVHRLRTGGAISANEVNTLELVQAYVGADFKDALGPGTKARIQLGRMTLNLGSRRLVAADDYRNTTNGYTGIRTDLSKADGTNLTLIYVLPQVRLPDRRPAVLAHHAQWDRESFDLQLWGGIASKPKAIAGATAELSYFGLAERDRPDLPTRDRKLHTFGARLIREPKPNAWDFEVEAYHQFGRTSASLAATATQLDVAAWFVHADVGHTFPGPLKLRLSAEFDFASGDRSGPGYQRFDTLFGMRRADLAPAGIYNAIGRANILTPGIRVEVAPGKRLDGFAVYRPMWLAASADSFSTTGVRDPLGQSGNFAGNQVEFRVRYWLVPGLLRAEVNGLWLAKGRFLRNAPNAPATGNTRYLATALSATF